MTPTIEKELHPIEEKYSSMSSHSISSEEEKMDRIERQKKQEEQKTKLENHNIIKTALEKAYPYYRK